MLKYIANALHLIKNNSQKCYPWTQKQTTMISKHYLSIAKYNSQLVKVNKNVEPNCRDRYNDSQKLVQDFQCYSRRAVSKVATLGEAIRCIWAKIYMTDFCIHLFILSLPQLHCVLSVIFVRYKGESWVREDDRRKSFRTCN